MMNQSSGSTATPGSIVPVAGEPVLVVAVANDDVLAVGKVGAQGIDLVRVVLRNDNRPAFGVSSMCRWASGELRA